MYDASCIEEFRNCVGSSGRIQSVVLHRPEQLLLNYKLQTRDGMQFDVVGWIDFCRRLAGGLSTLISSLLTRDNVVDNTSLAVDIFNKVVRARFEMFRGRRLVYDAATRTIITHAAESPRAAPAADVLEACLDSPGWQFHCGMFVRHELTVWLARSDGSFWLDDPAGRRRSYFVGRIFRTREYGRYYVRGGIAILRKGRGEFAGVSPQQVIDPNADASFIGKYVTQALAETLQRECWGNYCDAGKQLWLKRFSYLTRQALMPGISNSRQYVKAADKMLRRLRLHLARELADAVIACSIVRQVKGQVLDYVMRVPVASKDYWPAAATCRQFDMFEALLRTQRHSACSEVHRWRLASAALQLLAGENSPLFSVRK